MHAPVLLCMTSFNLTNPERTNSASRSIRGNVYDVVRGGAMNVKRRIQIPRDENSTVALGMDFRTFQMGQFKGLKQCSTVTLQKREKFISI